MRSKVTVTLRGGQSHDWSPLQRHLKLPETLALPVGPLAGTVPFLW